MLCILVEVLSRAHAKMGKKSLNDLESGTSSRRFSSDGAASTYGSERVNVYSGLLMVMAFLRTQRHLVPLLSRQAVRRVQRSAYVFNSVPDWIPLPACATLRPEASATGVVPVIRGCCRWCLLISATPHYALDRRGGEGRAGEGGRRCRDRSIVSDNVRRRISFLQNKVQWSALFLLPGSSYLESAPCFCPSFLPLSVLFLKSSFKTHFFSKTFSSVARNCPENYSSSN